MSNNIDISTQIKLLFSESIKTKQAAMEQITDNIASAVNLLANAFKDGHKILACGNGGSAADAQHFAAELICRFEKERPSLPAIALTTDSSALTAISNDYDFSQVFAKQINGLGLAGDILIAISTSGNSDNIIKAIETAHSKQLHIIALTGCDGGKIAALLNDQDIEIRVPSDITARIQEVHLLTIHCLCHQIDELLFPDN